VTEGARVAVVPITAPGRIAGIEAAPPSIVHVNGFTYTESHGDFDAIAFGGQRPGLFKSKAARRGRSAFLRFLPDSGKLVELSRQPAPRFQRMARDLEDARDGVVGMALDPSKGAILSLMVQSPDLKERVKQGGVIGYIILILGAIGVLIVIRRGIGLLLSRRAIDAQAKVPEANESNALGRLHKVARDTKGGDLEAINDELESSFGVELKRVTDNRPFLHDLAPQSEYRFSRLLSRAFTDFGNERVGLSVVLLFTLALGAACLVLILGPLLILVVLFARGGLFRLLAGQRSIHD